MKPSHRCCRLLLLVAGLLAAQLFQPAAHPYLPGPQRAEALHWGHAISKSMNGLLGPHKVEEYYYSMKKNLIMSLMLQYEACQEYQALTQSTAYHRQLNHVAILQAYMQDDSIPPMLLDSTINPEQLEKRLEQTARRRDFLSPAMRQRLQAIADKRRAAHIFSSRASAALSKLTGTTVLTLFDWGRSRGSQRERLRRYVAMAKEAAPLIRRSHAYSTQTKKFLQAWEEEMGLKERSKEELLSRYELTPRGTLRYENE